MLRAKQAAPPRHSQDHLERRQAAAAPAAAGFGAILGDAASRAAAGVAAAAGKRATAGAAARRQSEISLQDEGYIYAQLVDPALGELVICLPGGPALPGWQPAPALCHVQPRLRRSLLTPHAKALLQCIAHAIWDLRSISL
jgi:hypothetical protein